MCIRDSRYVGNALVGGQGVVAVGAGRPGHGKAFRGKPDAGAVAGVVLDVGPEAGGFGVADGVHIGQRVYQPVDLAGDHPVGVRPGPQDVYKRQGLSSEP